MSPMSSAHAGASGAPVHSSFSAAAAAAARAARFDPEDPGDPLDADEPDVPPRAPRPPISATASKPPASRPAKTLFMQRALDQIRPLQRMTREEFEAFLYQSRMYPSLSRFAPGSVEYFVPRRDVTVGLAMKTLRERIEHAAVIAELVCRLCRDDDDPTALCNDDEAVIAASAIRDDLREALGMLGVYEQAIREGVAVVQYHEKVLCETD